MQRTFGWIAVAMMVTADGGSPWPSIEESHIMSAPDAPPAVVRSDTRSQIDIGALLAAARGAPPIICSLAARTLSNGYWGGWADAPASPLPDVMATPDEDDDDDMPRRGRSEARYSAADVQRLLESLSSDDACVREVAVRVLGHEEHDPTVVNGLITRLRDQSVQLRQVAALGLGLLESDSAVTPLVQALRDTSAGVRANAAWALGRSENGRALAPLTGLLRDRDEKVRAAATIAVGQMDSVSAAVVLARVVREDQSAAVRRAAAWGLGNLEAREGVDALSSAVTGDKDVRVREMAAWALGNIEDSKGSAALLTAARRDDSDSVRETAVWALAQIEDRSSVDALGAIAASDRSARVRGTAAWAIGQIQDDEGHAPAGLVKLLADEDESVRLKAAWALGQIGDTSALPAIRDAMKREKNPRITKALIRALMKSGERSEETLTQLLDSPDPAIREAAVRGLAGSSPREPWPWPNPRPRPFP